MIKLSQHKIGIDLVNVTEVELKFDVLVAKSLSQHKLCVTSHMRRHGLTKTAQHKIISLKVWYDTQRLIHILDQ